MLPTVNIYESYKASRRFYSNGNAEFSDALSLNLKKISFFAICSKLGDNDAPEANDISTETITGEYLCREINMPATLQEICLETRNN